MHVPKCHSQSYGTISLCCLSLKPRLPGTVAKSQEMDPSSIQRMFTELLLRVEAALCVWGGGRTALVALTPPTLTD